MSKIRLDNVTKIFGRPMPLAPIRRDGGAAGNQVDRAFAARAKAQAEIASADQTGEGGKVMALDGVDMNIPDGQTVAVVGPSGCGKSTLLRVIAGLIDDYTGQVTYDEQDMRSVPPKDRYIGMVFQSYALYPHFMGRGNLSFFFRLHNVPDEETERRIRITSEIMGIGFDELLKRKPGTLSGGQQQRVAIGRAIVRNPRLFLFDEPLSNLDAKLRTQTRVEIKRLLHRFQITSVYVTHDQIEAVTLGDLIAVMRTGRVAQMATYQELLQHPANAFVAGFMGSPAMNLLAGGRVADGSLALEGLSIPLPEAIKARVSAGQELILGVRPEAARLVLEDGGLPEGIRLSGLAESVQPDFSRRTQLVYVRKGSFFYAAHGPIEPVVNVGEQVEVVFPADKLYFFDAESERRIV